MAHILINAVSAKSGGAATYVLNLVRQLADKELPHRFVIYVPAALAKELSEVGDRLSVVGTMIGSVSWWRRLLWDQVTLRRILKRERIDILVSSSDFGVLVPPCRQLLLIRNCLFFSRLYADHVLPRHSWMTRFVFRLKRTMILASARYSHRIMVASRAMLEDVQQFAALPPGRVVVNGFGVPLARFAASAAKPQFAFDNTNRTPFRLLYVSEYGDYKNFTTLFRAMRHLALNGRKDILLVTTADPWQNPSVASAWRNEDQILSRDPLVVPLVKHVGYVPYADVPRLYQESDALVFPSLAESFGHPLVEAMASGCPVIASDTLVNREVCGDAALYFGALDPMDLAGRILLLREDSDLREQLSTAGRKRAEQHFDWEDHVGRLLQNIEEVAVDA